MSIPQSLTPPPTPVTGRTPASRPKRERLSEKKKGRARALEQALLQLQDQYTEVEFQDILGRAVKDAHRLSEASRKSDRDRVLATFEHFEFLTLEEISEDAGLSLWVTNGVVQELVRLSLVKAVEQHNPAPSATGGRPQLIYSLIHTPVGSSFTLSDREIAHASDLD